MASETAELCSTSLTVEGGRSLGTAGRVQCKRARWLLAAAALCTGTLLVSRMLRTEHADGDNSVGLATEEAPSLFCFSVTTGSTYETALLLVQLARDTGIFACNTYEVLCPVSLDIGNLVSTKVFQPVKNTTTAKTNTEVFMSAWLALREDDRWQTHDWTIKVDPDAVLLPERLRTHLSVHGSSRVFVTNCNHYRYLPQVTEPELFGAVEAYSREAVSAFFQGHSSCRDYPMEDYWMQRCLERLGVKAVADLKLISDGRCEGVNCSDPFAAAFHPFKGADEWAECWSNATSMSSYARDKLIKHRFTLLA